MAKICIKCNASVNSKSMECPYCGATKFENEFIEPVNNYEQHVPQSNKNDGLYSNNIERLINLALSDGELTEKEKQVLFKKAEAEGIDLDEFEMVLDSKLKQLQISSPQVSSNHSYDQQNPTHPPAPLTSNAIPSREAYGQLEYFMDMALKDVTITQLEKQTIIEKAIALNIPQNEMEMILNAKIEEKTKLAAQTASPKSDKFGDVKKCPACGSIAQSFQTKCSDCSHEFSNIGANVSIGKLFEMLNACESDRKEESNSITGAFGSLMAKGLGQGDKVIEKKKSIISGFPIPNTKDDILEFLSTAIPNAKQKGNFFSKENPENKSHNDLAPTWFSKCEQIVMKAKFSMKDDKKVLEEIMQYAKEIGIK
jgi:hypothetical protein